MAERLFFDSWERASIIFFCFVRFKCFVGACWGRRKKLAVCVSRGRRILCILTSCSCILWCFFLYVTWKMKYFIYEKISVLDADAMDRGSRTCCSCWCHLSWPTIWRWKTTGAALKLNDSGSPTLLFTNGCRSEFSYRGGKHICQFLRSDPTL